MKISTWNVRSLCKQEVHEDLRRVLEHYDSDITALQEIRWKGHGIKKDRSKHRCDIYYSGGEKSMYGVGFAVRGKARSCVMRWEPISERICLLRLRGKFQNFTLICVYAPTLAAKEDQSEAFYDNLDKVFGSIPDYDVKLVIGDLNAQVGKEDIYQGIIGKHSLHHTTNDNGHRLIAFAASRQLVISGTFFPHLNIHKITWNSNDGKTKNQIDHILCDKRHASNILDVRSYRGANIDSDHHLVRAKLRCRIQANPRENTKRQRRFDVDALKTTTTASHFSQEITRQLDTTPSPGSIEETWKSISDVVKKVATEVVGFQKPQKPLGWRDEEYDDAVAQKDQARLRCLDRDTRGNREKYKEKRRFAVRVARRKKRQHKRKCLTELEDLRDRNEARKFYQNVNKGRKGVAPQPTFCKDKSGKLLTSEEQVVKRWEEYFAELLNGEESDDPHANENPSEPTYNNNDEVPPPTRPEVVTAIHKLKNNKSTGSDGIPAELFKAAGDSFIDHFHQLVTQIWAEEKMPEEWNLSIISPIFKKGDKHDCSNYRGISILNVAYKILSSIMSERLKPYIAGTVGPYQCGFMPGRSTTDQIFTLRQVIAKALAFQVDYHHLFVDFKQAYDTPRRDELFSAMNRFGFPAKLIKLSRMTLSNTWSCVKAAGKTSNKFRTVRGLKQGDALSCGFFNTILELIMQVANINTSHTIYNKSNQILGYADDLDLIGRTKEDVEESFTSIEAAANSIGLKVNEGKTKYMLTSTKERSFTDLGPTVTMGNHQFETVRKFVYLGSEITSENDVTVEIKRRIVLANKCLFGLRKFMRSKITSRRTKLKLYNELILPVLLYGSETWDLQITDERLLEVFERKVLRMIYGPVCIEGVWRSRFNHELYQLSQQPDVLKKVRTRRLRWAGHVSRMDDSVPSKRAFKNKPDGVRRVGRPNVTWESLVEKDARSLGVRCWRNASKNRENWANIIRQAESH